MNKNLTRASRGRPKTLNRDHVLNVAMHAYWQECVDSVSLNEICRQSKVSKPGLYREFGNEDGLMKAVLLTYQEQVITSMLQALTTEAPFQEALDNLVSLVTTANGNQEAPKGCLAVKMRESRSRVGEATRQQIDLAQQKILSAYEDWVERAKAKGEFSADMSSHFAAIYIDSQVSNALSQIARGEQSSKVKEILRMAVSVLV